MDTRGSRSRRGQRSGVVQRASGSASRRVRRFRRYATRPSPLLLRLHQEVLNGDVAPPKAVVHDLHLGLKEVELGSVMVKEVGGRRTAAAEEGKEAKEHAENLGDIGHTQLPW